MLSAVLCLALPCGAQKLGYPGSTGPNHAAAGGPIMSSRVPPSGGDAVSSLTANNPAKGNLGDESCLPWNISVEKQTAITVASLTVPSDARSEYEKACDANNKNKFTEAEQHARSAIEKFKSYSAAWVMLGMVLEEQNKRTEGLEACEHAVTVDSRYLPAYFCQAEFSARSREWEKVLNLADLAAGLNPAGDAYSDYYRAAALFRLKKMAEAKKSALAASDLDVTHENVPLYFLLAQIYKAEGDTINAEAQLRQLLKLHLNPQQEATARKMLDELGPQPESN
jgi:tetratricopeptide (TPR) repeat protein